MPHAIEPELLGPLPRRVRGRGGESDRMVTVFLAGLFGGLLVSAACASLMSLRFLGVAVLGPRATGIVTDKRSYDDEGMQYEVTYRFSVGGVPHRATRDVDSGSYDRVSIGATIPVRYFPGAPGYYSTPLPEGCNLLARCWLWLVIAIVFDAVSFGVVWSCRLFWIQKRLCRWGTPIIGQVVQKRDRGLYRLFYQFSPESAGRATAIQGKTLTTQDQLAQTSVGDAVTVLYDPKRPSRSLIYPFCPYEVGPCERSA